MPKARITAAFPPLPHDHASCVSAAQSRAGSAFADKGLRLTPLRASVFDEVAASHSAMSAYDILDRLARKGQRLAPISVYRALEALVEAGVVHRLESDNAYFACHCAHGRERTHVVMVCGACRVVAEAPAAHVFEAVDRVAAESGFAVDRAMIELRGTCGSCTKRTAP
jgi:Fur family zinc uptake transcriptional regulator